MSNKPVKLNRRSPGGVLPEPHDEEVPPGVVHVVYQRAPAHPLLPETVQNQTELRLEEPMDCVTSSLTISLAARKLPIEKNEHNRAVDENHQHF